jgi:hypothetical protein
MPIRKIFKEAFIRPGLAYANPHSFRKTLTQLGERFCHTQQVLTTFSS